MITGRINTYTCDTCGFSIVTEDIDRGTTPAFLRCKSKMENCPGTMVSAWYWCDQTLKAEYEWYRPKIKSKMSEAMKDHVRRGGLDIRKRRLPVDTRAR